MRETKERRAARCARVVARLDAAMPEAKIELDYDTPWQLLVAVVLSAQSTDRRVNLVTPGLHRAFPGGPADFARATAADVEPHLKTLGLFRNKARSLLALGRALEAEHRGAVPPSRAALAALPGVGNKTAGVVSMHLGGDRAFPVDTHVTRLSRRLGFTGAAQPDAIEADLRRLLPSERWFKAHQLLVWHGRRVCHARRPECHRCVVAELCLRRGVKRDGPLAVRAPRPTARPRRPSRRRGRS